MLLDSNCDDESVLRCYVKCQIYSGHVINHCPTKTLATANAWTCKRYSSLPMAKVFQTLCVNWLSSHYFAVAWNCRKIRTLMTGKRLHWLADVIAFQATACRELIMHIMDSILTEAMRKHAVEKVLLYAFPRATLRANIAFYVRTYTCVYVRPWERIE